MCFKYIQSWNATPLEKTQNIHLLNQNLIHSFNNFKTKDISHISWKRTKHAFLLVLEYANKDLLLGTERLRNRPHRCNLNKDMPSKDLKGRDEGGLWLQPIKVVMTSTSANLSTRSIMNWNRNCSMHSFKYMPLIFYSIGLNPKCHAYYRSKVLYHKSMKWRLQAEKAMPTLNGLSTLGIIGSLASIKNRVTLSRSSWSLKVDCKQD